MLLGGVSIVAGVFDIAAGLWRERREALEDEDGWPCIEGERRGRRPLSVGAPIGLAGKLEGRLVTVIVGVLVVCLGISLPEGREGVLPSAWLALSAFGAAFIGSVAIAGASGLESDCALAV